MPLLFARMVTLQRFGIIFTVVTLVAYALTMVFFNAMLMLAGPITAGADVTSVAEQVITFILYTLHFIRYAPLLRSRCAPRVSHTVAVCLL